MFANKFSKIAKNNSTTKLKNNNIKTFSEILSMIFSYYIYFIALAYSVLLIYKRHLPIGILITVLGLVEQLSWPAIEIANVVRDLHTTNCIKKDFYTNKVTLTDFQNESNNNENIQNILPDIKFSNVSFSYETKNILNNFNYCFKAKKKYLILGESGKGKTTLLKLILDYYSPHKGKVSFEPDTNVNIYKLSSIVRQNEELFIDSLYFNLTLGKDIPEEEVKKVLEKLNLDYLYYNENFKIANNSISLSGGEPLLHPQVFQIARSLSHKGYSVTIITNGLLLTNKVFRRNLCEIMKSNEKISLKISVEIKKSYHIKNVIEHLLEEFVKPSIAITIYNDTHTELKNFLDGVLKFNIPIELTFPLYKGNATYDSTYIEELKIISREMIKMSIKNNVNIISSFVSDVIYNYFINGHAQYNNCSICKNIKIDCEGNIYACPYFTGNNYIIGSVTEDDFEKIKLSSKHIIYSSFNLRNNNKCKNCQWQFICGGGCLAMRENNVKFDYSCEIYSYAFSFLNDYFKKY